MGITRSGQVGLAVACVVSLSGCATVAHGTHQMLTVTSDPPGAAVSVLSIDAEGSTIVRSKPGVTPLKLRLTRRDPHLVLRFEHDGCPSLDVKVKRTTNGWIFLDLANALPLDPEGGSSVGQAILAQEFFAGGILIADVLSGAVSTSRRPFTRGYVSAHSGHRDKRRSVH